MMLFGVVVLVLGLEAKAGDGEVMLSAGAGGFVMGADENLQSTWTLNGRVGYGLTEQWGLEAELGWMQGRTRTDFQYVYNGLTPRLDIMYTFPVDWKVQPFIVAGPGAIRKAVNRPSTSNTPNNDGFGNYVNPDWDFILNAGPGVLVPFGSLPLGLRLDARPVLNVGNEPHGDRRDIFLDFEAVAGLYWIPNAEDNDLDGDGITDDIDDCPEDPEDFDDFEDSDGCPDEDNDQDGVMDFQDECPMDPEDPDNFQDRNGCPDPDNDGDKFLDGDDGCPNEPEDYNGQDDGDGCPDDNKDTDKDKIPDLKDQCIEQPETYNGFEDKEGCPDELPKEVEKFNGVIRGINFEVDKDIITKDSYKVLNEALEILKKYEEVTLEVQGHTDSDADDAYNKDLSERRAKAVVDYFVSQGIDSKRLYYVGFGEEKPIAPNDTASNKAKNRRVEFRVLSSSENADIKAEPPQ